MEKCVSHQAAESQPLSAPNHKSQIASDLKSQSPNRRNYPQIAVFRAHTKGVVQQHTLLRRVLRSVLETAFEKVLRRVLRRCLAVCFTWKKGSEKGS